MANSEETINEFTERLDNLSSYKTGMEDGYERSIVDDLTGEEKSTPLNFFKKVIELKDTSKAGNVNNTELGQAEMPVRTSQQLSLYCDEMGASGWGSLFRKEAEIILSTSLSRDGFLPRLAVTTQKVTRIGQTKDGEQKKKGWFGRDKKDKEVQQY